jgi:serine/threonine protein kinase
MVDGAQLLRDFKEAFSYKYQLESDTPLGQGAYGAVYKAKDIDRGIDVAIKLFFDGHAPKGADRAWNLTSRLVHHQVVPTYTVETFVGEGKLLYKAVVSRFIPGKSLRQVFDWWNTRSTEQMKYISEDFSNSFLTSVIDALYYCHRSGFGHGDLHEGNIMVVPINYGNKNQFEAILIDFDNASFKSDMKTSSEIEKMQKDVRLMARITRNVTQEWKWGKDFHTLFESDLTIEEIKFAYQSVLTFISGIESGTEVNKTFRFAVKLLLPRAIGGVKIQPILKLYRTIATTAGKSEEFEEAYTQVLEDLKKPGAITDSVEITEIKNDRYNFYGSLFG